jgi:hypothetical protein
VRSAGPEVKLGERRSAIIISQRLLIVSWVIMTHVRYAVKQRLNVSQPESGGALRD